MTTCTVCNVAKSQLEFKEYAAKYKTKNGEVTRKYKSRLCNTCFAKRQQHYIKRLMLSGGEITCPVCRVKKDQKEFYGRKNKCNTCKSRISMRGHYKKHRHEVLNKIKTKVHTLHDSYMKQLITNGTDLSRSDVLPVQIEIKRKEIELIRHAKNTI